MKHLILITMMVMGCMLVAFGDGAPRELTSAQMRGLKGGDDCTEECANLWYYSWKSGGTRYYYDYTEGDHDSAWILWTPYDDGDTRSTSGKGQKRTCTNGTKLCDEIRIYQEASSASSCNNPASCTVHECDE